MEASPHPQLLYASKITAKTTIRIKATKTMKVSCSLFTECTPLACELRSCCPSCCYNMTDKGDCHKADFSSWTDGGADYAP